MTKLLLLMLPMVALAAFVAWMKLTGRTDRFIAELQREIGFKNSPYSLKPALFTPAELKFYHTLRELDYEDTDYFGKVRLADIYSVRAGLRGAEFGRAFGLIAQKHVDFLMVRRSDAKPVLAIELDDSSHKRPDRIKRDAFLDGVFAKAELPLVRIPVSGSYSPAKLNEIFQEAMDRKPPVQNTKGGAGWRLS